MNTSSNECDVIYERPLYQISVFVLQVFTTPLHVIGDVQESHILVFISEEEDEKKYKAPT